MGDAPLKSVVLLACMIVASACGDGQIGPGGQLSDTSIGEPRADDYAYDADGGIDETPPFEDSPTVDGPPTVDDPPSQDEPTPPLPVGDDPDRPWAHNTGPSDPAALVSSGSRMITTDGAVLENIDVNGDIWIDADDVTLRNFRINASGVSYGIKVLDGHSGIVIEDGEIYNMSSAAVLGVGFTARRLHIHDSSGDGIKAQGFGGTTLVEHCFIEKLGRGAEAHADGNQTRGGSNTTFRYNNIYMPAPGTANHPGGPYKANATFFMQLDVSNFVIENNWLNGGGYTIYCIDDGSPGVSVRDNQFGRDYDFGLLSGDCAEWSGNVWEDTGEPI